MRLKYFIFSLNIFLFPLFLHASGLIDAAYMTDFSDDLNYQNYSAEIGFSKSDESDFFVSDYFSFKEELSESDIYPERYYRFKNRLTIGDEYFSNFLSTEYSFENTEADLENADVFVFSGFRFMGSKQNSVYAGIWYTNSFSLFGLVDERYPLPYFAWSFNSDEFSINFGIPLMIRYHPGRVFSADFTYFPDLNIGVNFNFHLSSGFAVTFNYDLKAEQFNIRESENSDDELFNRYQECGMKLKFLFGKSSFYVYNAYRYDNSLYYGSDAFDNDGSVDLDESYYLKCGLEIFI